MKTAAEQIAIDPWNSAIGAKAELQSAKGIPHDKRSMETCAYGGSLVGVAREVDERTLHKHEYVRICIACWDVSKVPDVVEGAIVPYIYDFHFEREVIISEKNLDTSSKVTVEGGGNQPTPKKQRTDSGFLGNPGSAVVKGGSQRKKGNENQIM